LTLNNTIQEEEPASCSPAKVSIKTSKNFLASSSKETMLEGKYSDAESFKVFIDNCQQKITNEIIRIKEPKNKRNTGLSIAKRPMGVEKCVLKSNRGVSSLSIKAALTVYS
jgi:hypothetical protein